MCESSIPDVIHSDKQRLLMRKRIGKCSLVPLLLRKQLSRVFHQAERNAENTTLAKIEKSSV